MSIKISYKTKSSVVKPRNLIFFVNEQYSVSGLKKYFTKSEHNFISDILKSLDLTKKVISFDLSSKKKIFLISLKKNITSFDVEISVWSPILILILSNILFSYKLNEK